MERKPLQSTPSDGFNDKVIFPHFIAGEGQHKQNNMCFVPEPGSKRVMRISECEQPIIVNLQRMKCISMCERGCPVISWGRRRKMSSIDFRKRQNKKKDG